MGQPRIEIVAVMRVDGTLLGHEPLRCEGAAGSITTSMSGAYHEMLITFHDIELQRYLSGEAGTVLIGARANGRQCIFCVYDLRQIDADTWVTLPVAWQPPTKNVGFIVSEGDAPPANTPTSVIDGVAQMMGLLESPKAHGGIADTKERGE